MDYNKQFLDMIKEGTTNYHKKILDIVKEEVTNYYHIPVEYLNHSIKGTIEKEDIMRARRVAIYLAFRLTGACINRTMLANSFGMYSNNKFDAEQMVTYICNNFGGSIEDHQESLEADELYTICKKKRDDIIEEIRKSVDIVDIIRNCIPLEKRGKNYFGICPFHEDTLPTLSVSPEKQIYKCFSCGASGNAITFVNDYRNSKFFEMLDKYDERDKKSSDLE